MEVKIKPTIISIKGFEKVLHWLDPSRRFTFYIAIHNTFRGPALGGVRIFPYQNEKEALEDVLRLAQAMTYKSAGAELPLGGGKAVIIAQQKEKTPSLLHNFAKLVNFLKGKYITAEDVGSCVEDMIEIRKITPYVAGLPKKMKGSGDPSPMTGYGVFQAIRACLKFLGETSLKHKIVAIQGVGKTGYNLAKYLKRAGTELILTDINQKQLLRTKKILGAKTVAPDAIYSQKCDIFSPCALGSVLNQKTIPLLRAKIVAGSANNVLEKPEDGKRLFSRKIIYAPDYIANAGGIINISVELEKRGYSEERARNLTEKIYHRTLKILELSKKRGLPTSIIANQYAEARFENLKEI